MSAAKTKPDQSRQIHLDKAISLLAVLTPYEQDSRERIPIFGFSSHRCATRDQKIPAAITDSFSLLRVPPISRASIRLPTAQG